MKSFWRWVPWLGALAIAICALAGVALLEFYLHRPRLAVQALPGARTVQIAARDGVPLRAWLLRPLNPTGDAILILHGSGNNRASQLGLARMFLGHGYTVLAPDNRGQGESGGNLVTYGLYEADDVRRWVSWLIGDQHPLHVFGLGESLGGVVLIESLTVEPRFSAIVAECAFSSFERIARDRIATKLPLPRHFGRLLALAPIWAGFLYARWRHGLDFRQASPEAAIALSTTPVLLIHGLNDTQTSPVHSRILASKAPRNAVLWLVPGAGHTGAFQTAPREFEERVLGFFASHRSIDTRPPL